MTWPPDHQGFIDGTLQWLREGESTAFWMHGGPDEWTMGNMPLMIAG